MNIEIKTRMDDLHENRHTFMPISCGGGHKLVLYTYKEMERKTKRHGFKATRMYSRIGRKPEKWEKDKMSVDEVELSAEIKQRVMNEFISTVEVTK